MGELMGNKEDWVWQLSRRARQVRERWKSCVPEHVMSAPRELLSHASSKERYSPTASFFHPASRSRVMARRLLPLTVLTGIFAALGTGFLVLLFGRDSFAAVLIMLAWICTLCFVIYLLILAVSLFIQALSHLLRGGGQR